MIIAVDGPASSGKGTVAKKLAEHFNLPHLNTGALYRIVGYKALQNNIDLENIKELGGLVKNIESEDFEATGLYNEKVGEAASKIASNSEIRKILLDFQRNFANNARGAVLDGRDIGTVICPNADYKFFITASVEERAKRRFKESKSKGISISYEQVLEKLKERDYRDSNRSIAPLVKASDAIEIDTTEMSIDEVFKCVLSMIK
ncbi:(d)CMP kinase [Pseudomonadota bacterium]